MLSPKVSVSGHVYDIATGRLTTAVDARYPTPQERIADQRGTYTH
jgi:carbonic anhydrase